MAAGQVALTMEGVAALVAAVEGRLPEYRALPAMNTGRAYDVEDPHLEDNGWLTGTVTVPLADRRGGIDTVATAKMITSFPPQSVLGLIQSIEEPEKK